MWTNCHLENAAYPSATVAGYPLGKNSANPLCRPACARPLPSPPSPSPRPPPPPPPPPPAASPARTATIVLSRPPRDPLDSLDSLDSKDPLRKRAPNTRTDSARVRSGHAAPSRQCAAFAAFHAVGRIRRWPAAVISGARAFGSNDPTTFSARSNERRMAERTVAVSDRGAPAPALRPPANAPHPLRGIMIAIFATQRGHIETGMSRDCNVIFT